MRGPLTFSKQIPLWNQKNWKKVQIYDKNCLFFTYIHNYEHYALLNFNLGSDIS